MAATMKAQIARITRDLQRVAQERDQAQAAYEQARQAAQAAKERRDTAMAASEALIARIAQDTPELEAFVQALQGAPKRTQRRTQTTVRKNDHPQAPEGVDPKGWARGCEFAEAGKPLSDNPFQNSDRKAAFVQAYTAMSAYLSA
jgi:hypothetical protein